MGTISIDLNGICSLTKEQMEAKLFTEADRQFLIGNEGRFQSAVDEIAKYFSSYFYAENLNIPGNIEISFETTYGYWDENYKLYDTNGWSGLFGSQAYCKKHGENDLNYSEIWKLGKRSLRERYWNLTEKPFVFCQDNELCRRFYESEDDDLVDLAMAVELSINSALESKENYETLGMASPVVGNNTIVINYPGIKRDYADEEECFLAIVRTMAHELFHIFHYFMLSEENRDIAIFRGSRLDVTELLAEYFADSYMDAKYSRESDYGSDDISEAIDFGDVYTISAMLITADKLNGCLHGHDSVIYQQMMDFSVNGYDNEELWAYLRAIWDSLYDIDIY